jgi:hypothetical protein
MEIATALSALTTLASIAKGALESRDDEKARQAVLGISEKLLDVYTASLHLAERTTQLQATVHDLEGKLRAAEAQIEEKSRYALVPLGRFGRAYTQTADNLTGDPSKDTYFCQHCHDKGIKSILRYFPGAQWGGPCWECVESTTHNIPA